MILPLGWAGSIFLPENESHIYPNMSAKFGLGREGRREGSGEGRGGEGRGGRGGSEGGSEGGARAKSLIRPPTLRNITSSNIER